VQTIVTDDRGVCLSVVSLSVSLSVTRHKSVSLCKTAQRIQILFGVNSLGGPRNTVLDREPDPPTVWGRESLGEIWST